MGPLVQTGINSLRPSYAYMRRYTMPSLAQIMACRLTGAKPLSEPMLPYCQLDHKEYISVKFHLKLKYVIQENAFETVVCEMAAIFVYASMC